MTQKSLLKGFATKIQAPWLGTGHFTLRTLWDVTPHIISHKLFLLSLRFHCLEILVEMPNVTNILASRDIAPKLAFKMVAWGGVAILFFFFFFSVLPTASEEFSWRKLPP